MMGIEQMACSTFDRKMVITDPDSFEKIKSIMSAEAPKRNVTDCLISREGLYRSEELLRRCKLRFHR